MPVILAYLGVTFIWSTAPLASKWSGEGAGFLFGVAALVTLGLLVYQWGCAAFRHFPPRG